MECLAAAYAPVKQHNLALTLIEKEKRKRTGKLDLGNCGLTEMSERYELVWLGELILAQDWCESFENKTRKFKNSQTRATSTE